MLVTSLSVPDPPEAFTSLLVKVLLMARCGIHDLAPVDSSTFIHPGPASVASWLFSSVSRAHSLSECLCTSCPPCPDCCLPTHLHGSLCHLIPSPLLALMFLPCFMFSIAVIIQHTVYFIIGLSSVEYVFMGIGIFAFYSLIPRIVPNT